MIILIMFSNFFTVNICLYTFLFKNDKYAINTLCFEVITLTPEMYLKLMKSFKLSEGAYVFEKNYK